MSRDFSWQPLDPEDLFGPVDPIPEPAPPFEPAVQLAPPAPVVRQEPSPPDPVAPAVGEDTSTWSDRRSSQRPYTVEHLEAERRRLRWVLLGMACLCIFLIVLQLGSCASRWIPGPNPGPEPDDSWPHEAIEGVAVLVIESEADKPRGSWSKGQVNSLAAVQVWAVEHAMPLDGGPAYANFDLKQDIAKANPLWTLMRGEVTLQPPVVAVLSGDHFTQFQLPVSDKATVEALEAAAQ